MNRRNVIPVQAAIHRSLPLASLLLLACLSLLTACARKPVSPAPVVVHTFADVPVRELRSHPDAHVGEVFDERFVFFRIWWSHDRKRPGKPSLDLPTHFNARIAAAPAYTARIEFPPVADSLFENMREGTDVRLRVRFLRLHPASYTPVFAFEKLLPAAPAPSPVDQLRERN
jgi:hypothetical protein